MNMDTNSIFYTDHGTILLFLGGVDGGGVFELKFCVAISIKLAAVQLLACFAIQLRQQTPADQDGVKFQSSPNAKALAAAAAAYEM